MSRSLVVAGGIVLALMPPAVTLAAPPAPVYVPANRAAAPARPVPARSSDGRSDSFKVPFDVDVRPRSLAGTMQPKFDFKMPNAPVPYPAWRGWRSNSAYWYPALLLQPACNTMPIGPDAPAPDVTIGSLVDGQGSSLFSSPSSYATKLASGGSSPPATSGPLTLQYGVQATPCGPSNLFYF